MEGGRGSPPPQKDPKWQVLCDTLPVSLTPERTQPLGWSQVIIPTHRVRLRACRLLHGVQDRRDRVWHYAKKYDEDLNTTLIKLIFVCRSSPGHVNYLIWSVPCRQSCFRRRCPFGLQPATNGQPVPLHEILVGEVGGARSYHGHCF